MQNAAIQTYAAPVSFDLFKLPRSSQEVQVSPNTLRKWNAEGKLNFYRQGKDLYASRSEILALMKSNPVRVKPSRKMAAIRRQRSGK